MGEREKGLPSGNPHKKGGRGMRRGKKTNTAETLPFIRVEILGPRGGSNNTQICDGVM